MCIRDRAGSMLGFPNDVVANAVRIALSPGQPSHQQLASMDSFLSSAVLRILNNTPRPIHTVNRTFEQTFRMPFRAFRQASLQAFLEVHPEFAVYDAYVCPASLHGHFPMQGMTGPLYFSLCDHIEEQEVVLWRLREELASLETSLVGHSSNSHLLGGFVSESEDVHDFSHVLTFKVVATTPAGTELPILIEPRHPAGDVFDDITTARNALTRIVQREMAILRKTDETVGFEMTDHKHQIAALKMKIDDEVERLCRMYDEADKAYLPGGPSSSAAVEPLPRWEGQRSWTTTRASRTETEDEPAQARGSSSRVEEEQDVQGHPGSHAYHVPFPHPHPRPFPHGGYHGPHAFY
eukprot:TRINITY_DN8898_c0_g1_i3.p1 TRINITY_DN8898_c0_g1~~TRINITY_DN8898_c0_g1_i3.p1  ORF type:complete len:351 (-),score=89.48 TRINITY_DN8898_c0_g1_i3:401-1453(-)